MTETLEEITEKRYAGFGKRMAAMLIDRVIISIASNYAYWEIHREALRSIEKNQQFYKKIFPKVDTSYDMADNLAYVGLSFVFIFVLWCYNAGMESSPWKGTIGKRLIGLEVSDLSGNRVSFIKATGRYFGKTLSIIVLCFGYIAMLFNDKKQTWHDSMSGCIVTEK